MTWRARFNPWIRREGRKKDERGQSTVEYILILAVVVMIAMKFKTMIGDRLERATGKIGEKIEGTIEKIE